MGNTLTRVLEGQSTYGDSRPCVGFVLDDCGTQIEIMPISRSGRPLRKARIGVSTRILRELGLALLAADSWRNCGRTGRTTARRTNASRAGGDGRRPRARGGRPRPTDTRDPTRCSRGGRVARLTLIELMGHAARVVLRGGAGRRGLFFSPPVDFVSVVAVRDDGPYVRLATHGRARDGLRNSARYRGAGSSCPHRSGRSTSPPPRRWRWRPA